MPGPVDEQQRRPSVGKFRFGDENLECHAVKEEDADRMLAEIKFCVNNNGTESVPKLRAELQESMMANAGVFRTEETLLKQRAVIAELRERYRNIRIDDKSKIFNTDLQEAIEFGQMLDYSSFIVEGAIARKESRGAHYRDDYPKRDDENFLKHTFATMNEDGSINIEYGDVVLGKFEPQERKY